MKRTLWQRLWSSPWTWLAGWGLSVALYATSHGWPQWGWLVISLIYISQFFNLGDKRWGKP